MPTFDVCYRALDKAGESFIEQRREDGHGSEESNPTHVTNVTTDTILGEVSTNPTENTLLGRLKDIHEAVDGLEISVDNIDVNTDELETKIDELKQINIDFNADFINESNEIQNILNSVITTEDAASVDGQKGVPVMAVSNEDQSDLVNADGDETRLATDKKGNLYSSIVNLPTEYPLPTSQVSALTPQTDALTDAELRASPVAVDTGLTQPTTPTDTQPVSAASLPLPTGAATAANQLPDNHQVTVSNQINQPLEEGGSVNVSNFPASQTVDGTVSVGNFPSEYPLPAAQVSTLTPQTDALTDAELRASPVSVENMAQLVPEQYDEIALSYTGDDLTGVVYKNATVTVATLTLGYTGGKLTSVVRS